MIVSQKKEFQPIVITIQSYEEACALWHQLFIPTKHRLSSCRDVDGFDDSSTVEQMFNDFESVFEPKTT